MSTITINTQVDVGNGSGYLRNIGRAARALLAAILAVPAPRKGRVSKSASDMSPVELYRLARSYDAVMPNLAQELRSVATRGY